jgi:hypothetical protein
MLQAALAAECSPRSLSFTAALQIIPAVGLVAATIDGDLTMLIQLRLAHIASYCVGNRPSRVEPRAVKRRPKPHKLLTEPRDATRAK